MGLLSQTYRVRLSTPADHAAVDQLLARSYPQLLKKDYLPSVRVTAIPIISRANPTLLKSGSYYVVEQDGRILGAGGWTHAAPTRSRGRAGEGHVRHVATDPAVVRQGVGRALMEAVLNHAREQGVVRLNCLSTLTAVPFYSALGFVERRRLDVPLAPGIEFPAVEMDLRLG